MHHGSFLCKMTNLVLTRWIEKVVVQRWSALLKIHVIPQRFASWFPILFRHPARLHSFMFRIQKEGTESHRNMVVCYGTQKVIIELKRQRKLEHDLRKNIIFPLETIVIFNDTTIVIVVTTTTTTTIVVIIIIIIIIVVTIIIIIIVV